MKAVFSINHCFIKIRKALFSGFVLLLGFSVTNAGFAQQAVEEQSIKSASTILIALGVLMGITIIVLLVCLYVIYALNLILNKEERKTRQKAVKDTGPALSLWQKLNHRFGAGKLVSVEEEEEIMLDHTYDGISELNNHMPPWLKYLFYVSIIFAVVYVLHYLVLETGKLQIEEYQEELAEAAKIAEAKSLLAGNTIDENNVTLVTEAAALATAQTLYVQNCAACHGADGGGGVGPNLADEYWLHGGSLQDIFKVIKYGVQEKGMIPWQDKLSPEEMQDISSYILTLQGTTPSNPKAPQGEKYEGEKTPSGAISTL